MGSALEDLDGKDAAVGLLTTGAAAAALGVAFFPAVLLGIGAAAVSHLSSRPSAKVAPRAARPLPPPPPPPVVTVEAVPEAPKPAVER